MQQVGVNYRFTIYPDVQHGFANSSSTQIGVKFGLPLAYNEHEDKDPWQ